MKCDKAMRFIRSPIQWAVNKWDWTIYRLAYGSLRRMCAKEPAFALLLERWIQEWREENPMPSSLEASANRFFDAAISKDRTDNSSGRELGGTEMNITNNAQEKDT